MRLQFAISRTARVLPRSNARLQTEELVSDLATPGDKNHKQPTPAVTPPAYIPALAATSPARVVLGLNPRRFSRRLHGVASCASAGVHPCEPAAALSGLRLAVSYGGTGRVLQAVEDAGARRDPDHHRPQRHCPAIHAEHALEEIRLAER